MTYGPKYTKRIGTKNIFIWIAPSTNMDQTKIVKDYLSIYIFKLQINFVWNRDGKRS